MGNTSGKRKNLEESLRQVVNESIRNAERWLNDAKLIIQDGSIAHGCVLCDFAGEEIAKAYACWKALTCAIPLNHPLLKPRRYEDLEVRIDKLKKEIERDAERVKQGKNPVMTISVFRSHRAKNTLVTELGSTLIQFGIEKNQSFVRKETENANTYLGHLNMIMGEAGTLKRTEWMYVNLTTSSQDELAVTSPLCSEIEDIERKVLISAQLVQLMKTLATVQLQQAIEANKGERKSRESSDWYFPSRPLWAEQCESSKKDDTE